MHVFFFVFLATIVEATGDAVLRVALHSHAMPARIGLFLLGAMLLTVYGTSLNLAPVEFGTVTGLYVALLFVVFQVTNYLFFRAVPTTSTWIGGTLIVAGGTVIYLFR